MTVSTRDLTAQYRPRVDVLALSPQTSGFKSAFARYVRLWAWATASGMLVGVLVFGLLARVAMRVLAVTSGDAVQGAFSDDAEEIGRITAGGTITFILFIGLGAGTLGGWAYALLRPLFPTNRRWRALASGGVAGVFGALVLVNPDGRDFSILGPSWLVVALFVAIPFLFGVLIPAVAERLRHFYETAPMRFPHLLAFAPLLVVIPAFFFLLPGLVIGVVYAATRDRRGQRWLLPAARVVVAAGVTAMAVLGVVRITEVESRDPQPSDFVEPVFD